MLTSLVQARRGRRALHTRWMRLCQPDGNCWPTDCISCLGGTKTDRKPPKRPPLVTENAMIKPILYAALPLMLAGGATAGFAADPIKIGVTAPLSGSYAAAGIDIVDGGKQAAA